MTLELHEDKNGFLYLYNPVTNMFCDLEIKSRCHPINSMEELGTTHLATFWERSPDYTVKSKDRRLNQILERDNQKD